MKLETKSKMKKVTVLFLTIILSCIGIMVHAQKLYDIRLEPMEISPASKACYDIQLRSSLAQDLNLAGQTLSPSIVTSR